MLNAQIPSGVIGHDASSLAHQQHPRRHVPRREALFPESVEASGGDIRQVDRGGTRSANSGDAERDPRELLLVSGQPFEAVEWKSGADQGMYRIGDRRYLEAPLSLPGASAPRGVLKPVHRNMQDHSRLDLAIHRRGDRDGVHGKAVQEVRGPIQRIHDPDQALGRDGG